MKQMQINGQDARQSVCTEIKGGWSLLRTSDCAEGREYALRAHRKTDRTLRILEQTLYAMLEGLSVAVLVEDNTGRIAHMAMQAVKGQAPDCRLLARAGGTAFVALPEPDACRTVVEKLAELSHGREDVRIRIAGYMGACLPEVRFAGLLKGGADVELLYTGGACPELRFRTRREHMTADAVWTRLYPCWQAAA